MPKKFYLACSILACVILIFGITFINALKNQKNILITTTTETWNNTPFFTSDQKYPPLSSFDQTMSHVGYEWVLSQNNYVHPILTLIQNSYYEYEKDNFQPHDVYVIYFSLDGIARWKVESFRKYSTVELVKIAESDIIGKSNKPNIRETIQTMETRESALRARENQNLGLTNKKNTIMSIYARLRGENTILDLDLGRYEDPEYNAELKKNTALANEKIIAQCKINFQSIYDQALIQYEAGARN